MIHFDVNWIAIIVATIASMGLGMAWYMSLGNQWMAALGKTREDIMGEDGKSGSMVPFIFAGLMQLVMAYFLAVLTPILFASSSTTQDIAISDGIFTGIHMWLGFIITSMIINHRYQMQKWSLTLIDGGYLLGVMVVQGLVIGLIG